MTLKVLDFGDGHSRLHRSGASTNGHGFRCDSCEPGRCQVSEVAEKKTDMDRLNDLITWYEQNKPDSGQRIPVAKGPKALAEMLGVSVASKDPVKEHRYRDRIIYATGTDPVRSQR